MEISNNLKIFFEKLKSNNITATEIAKKLNISKKTLSNYINGDAYIPLEHLNNLSNILNVSIDYILNINNTPNYSKNKNIKFLNATEIGNRIKKLRQNNAITQDKLAKDIGVNKSSISKYENGKNLILTICLYTICKKYNVSADYLLGKIDYEPKL